MSRIATTGNRQMSESNAFRDMHICRNGQRSVRMGGWTSVQDMSSTSNVNPRTLNVNPRTLNVSRVLLTALDVSALHVSHQLKLAAFAFTPNMTPLVTTLELDHDRPRGLTSHIP